MNCPHCNGVIPMVGWNDKEFYEHCPWCGIALEIEEESTEEENADETTGI